MEKDELESDEETDKSRSNALWADFLSDVRTEKQKCVSEASNCCRLLQLDRREPNQLTQPDDVCMFLQYHHFINVVLSFSYLERQDFLQRTDLRQFEIEKNLRQTRRQN
ncbi:uncharacterized protein LOC117191696 [Drosophila miranda]|uniref:uncharacterized protein LOC117191696 n=1 Tax=Drosophila miranda TaxID=7229 RepID=UPI00143F10FB|nr:uncharacterized protein LOC117191696 [Drosophila miranda]